jgi:hypothetical protein
MLKKFHIYVPSTTSSIACTRIHESIYNRLAYTIDMAWNMRSFNKVILVKEIAHAITIFLH